MADESKGESVVETIVDAASGEPVDGHAPGGPLPTPEAKEAGEQSSGMPVEPDREVEAETDAPKEKEPDSKKEVEAEDAAPADDKDSGWSEVVSRASDLGLDEKGMKAEFGTPDEAKKALRILDRGILAAFKKPKEQASAKVADAQIPAKPETPAEKKAFDKHLAALAEEGISENIIGALKAQHEETEARLASLSETNGKQAEQLKKAEFDGWVRKFDREVERLGADYESAIGKGATDELEGASATKRWELFENAMAYGQAMERMGKRVPLKQCVEAAVSMLHQDVKRAALEKQVVQKAEGQTRRLLARPSSRETKEPVGEKSTIRALRGKLQQMRDS